MKSELRPAEIRRIRKVSGATQAGFGAAMNLTANSVARLERGEMFPSRSTLTVLYAIRSYLEGGGSIGDFAKSIGR
jgi:DNA-binding transcriptional regulator YiaG